MPAISFVSARSRRAGLSMGCRPERYLERFDIETVPHGDGREPFPKTPTGHESTSCPVENRVATAASSRPCPTHTEISAHDVDRWSLRFDRRRADGIVACVAHGHQRPQIRPGSEDLRRCVNLAK